ncbi:MAG: aminopeptidase [Candidatus Dadabacteria bacterium]|nr:MAG: aminopeptidase [Candidatus Dadabacteria bacterium]
MEFTKKLRDYAELIVTHGLNVQRGQIVNINTEACHREFAYICAEAAYLKGAKYVNIDLREPRLAKMRIEVSELEDLKYVPLYLPVKYRELVDEAGANLAIVGPEDPDLMESLDPRRVNTVRFHQRMAIKYFYDEGIGKSRVHWTVVAAATEKWGKKVFPEADPKEACSLLWEEIFRICRIGSGDSLEQWEIHNAKLKERARKLTSLKIKELHFTGEGTDLTVGLSQKAIFKGGSSTSIRNVDFEPNIPTEECFTTPDWRKTAGKARATRPFLVNGKLVEGLELTFENGEITECRARAGLDTFREYIASDPGAKRLGEVALVGIDSPIYKSGLVFQEILFDENAACHIAVGAAYKNCLEGGEGLSEEECEQIGCNDSTVHTDIMISDETMRVDATCWSGDSVTLIDRGQWCQF